jgi:PAS domain S-box-containing protein
MSAEAYSENETFNREENTVHRVFETLPVGVMLTDTQGIIQYVNPAFESATGYSRHEVLGQTPQLLKSGQHPDEFFSHLWTQLRNGQDFQGTTVNRKKTGELYWAEQTITPIRDETGDLTHFVAVLQDVTELRKQQEQEVQLRLAREIQQRFYGAAPKLPGFDLGAAAYPASQTGGDYFDFIPMANDCLAIAVGDVEGHGFGSALVMALTRAYLRSFAAMELRLDQILALVNHMLVKDLESECFVTLALACLDLRRRLLTYCGAGHVPGFVIGPWGDVVCRLESAGPPLGLFLESKFESQKPISLEPGHVVVFLTDGITESTAPDGTEFGNQRTLEYVWAHHREPASQIADGLHRAARAFAFNEPQDDDTTSVIVKVNLDTP